MKNSFKSMFAILLISVMLCGCNDKTDSNSSVSDYQSDSESSVDTFSDIEISENSVDDSSDIEVSETSVDTSAVYNFEKKYFVNKLNTDMVKNFISLYNAAVNFQEYVSFENAISSDELDILMYLLNYDCPELIHLSGNYFPEYINSECTNVSAVTLSYIMNQSEYDSNMKQLNTFFDNLKNTLSGKSELEKEMYVYNYLFDNCVYDEVDNLSGSVCGAVLKNKGRCEAFSKSFLWCMQELDIECMALLGKPKWNTNAIYANHSWNIVKIDGNYYHVDITVDNIRINDDETSVPFYAFFNVDDEFMLASHGINTLYNQLGVPECTSTDKNYHIMNNQYIDGSTDIQTALDKILTEKFETESESVSVRFKNSDDYDFIIENIDTYTENYNIIYNDLAYAIIFSVKE